VLSLLKEIYELASGDGDVTTALRKCKILAARLRSDELARWVAWELDGYPEQQATPEYRHLTVIYFSSFIGAWNVPKQPIPLQIVPEEHRDKFRYIEFRDGIAKAFSFTRAKHGVVIHRPDLVPAVHKKLYPTLTCHHVWCEIPPVEFEQLISSVKNRIVDFSLKIEAENPEAGEAPPNTQPVPPEKLQPIIQNVFNAPVGNLAQNSEHFNQTANIEIPAQDLQKFVADFSHHLAELNLDEHLKRKVEAQLATIKAQLDDEPNPVIVREAGRTLRNLTEGVVGNLIATAAQPAVWQSIQKVLELLG